MSTSVSTDTTAALSTVSNLFITVLGHEAGADGFAGEDDNLNYWTSQLQAGMSVSAIRTSFADSGEAQTVLGTAYQSIFGQAMGSATLAAAQTYLASGGYLQLLEALWSSAQPQLLAEFDNLYGAGGSAAALDAAVALVTSGSSISSAEASWATQAKTDVSNLFKAVLGQTAGSDGYAGESDGLSTWTTDAEQGMSIANIQSQLAYGSEAKSDLTSAYQSSFGQAIGTATLQAAQQQLAAGVSLQQLETLWSTVKTLVGSSYQAAFGQAANAAQLDVGVSQATAQTKNSGAITITWDLSNGTSQSYTYTLTNPATPVVQTWSGLSGTGTLVSTTGGTGATGSSSGSGSIPGLTVTSVSQVNGQLVLVGTKSTGGAATLQESIDGSSSSTLWNNMPDGSFNFSSWFNVNLANGPHTVTLSFQGSTQTLKINFTVGSSTSSSTTTSSTSSTSSSTAPSSGSGSMSGLTVSSVSQVNGQLVLVGTKSTGGNATLQETIDGGSSATLWNNMPDGPFNFSSWFNVNLANGSHTIVLSFQGSSQTLTINFTVGSASPVSSTSAAAISPVSNLFTTVLGYQAGADGYAGENDNLAYWTGQLAGGMSLSAIRTALADGSEAQTVLGTAYQSVFGQTMGPATLKAAQSYLANGGSLQQLEALWSSAQPQLTAQVNNLYGAAMSTTPLDTAVALVTSGSSISSAETGWATQAETDVSTLFQNVLGYTPGSDGYAGESDNLSG